jgi:hypothetical protein
MVMLERYGSPSTRIINLVSAWQVPFRNVQPGDRILILTDDAQDPLVWQSAMAALNERGAQVMLGLYPRVKYHNDAPPDMAIEASRGCDVLIALTTTALNSGTPALRKIRKEGGGTGQTPIWLMEEITTEILTEGGGRATVEDLEQICALQRRVAEVYDRGKWIHVTSERGTDLTARIDEYPPGYHVKRREEMPFSRDRETGRLGGGTWPFGEVHVEPLPGTANGTVVWDTTAHHPPGLWREPVALTVKDGKVVDIQGGSEAEEVRWYLETYGDENSWLLGGEIAIGTNHRAWPAMGQMRNDKKRYGAMHLGIGHGSDRGIIMSSLRLEGIIARVSVVVDEEIVICDKGKIVV